MIHKFQTEAALCQAFIEHVTADGWQVYPETSDWDMVLVKDGIQVGVQAKLRPNLTVLYQCLSSAHLQTGVGASQPIPGRPTPHFMAVLVPALPYKKLREFVTLCRHLRILLVTLGPHRTQRTDTVRTYPAGNVCVPLNTQLPQLAAYRLETTTPVWVPAHALPVAAGASSPAANTAWKENAMRLLARACLRGFITSQDAKQLNIDFTFISQNTGWFVRCTEKSGNYIRWQLTSGNPSRPDLKYPEAFKAYVSEQAQVLGQLEAGQGDS